MGYGSAIATSPWDLLEMQSGAQSIPTELEWEVQQGVQGIGKHIHIWEVSL